MVRIASAYIRKQNVGIEQCNGHLLGPERGFEVDCVGLSGVDRFEVVEYTLSLMDDLDGETALLIPVSTEHIARIDIGTVSDNCGNSDHSALVDLRLLRSFLGCHIAKYSPLCRTCSPTCADGSPVCSAYTS